MKQYSTFLKFSRLSWKKLRLDVPMTLSEADVLKLQGQIEKLSSKEVEEVYLPLARLLNLYVTTAQSLFETTSLFLGNPKPKVPYIIAVAGSVAVGKSTTSRILKALLERWPDHRRVEIVTTDGFLYPNEMLEKKGLILRKGFPESYDLGRLISFLTDLKAGKPNLKVPTYSHHSYDIIPDEYQNIDRPNIVIIEGLNVLQIGHPTSKKLNHVFVSDFIDFSIYVDAETGVIRQWFLDRFWLFRDKAKKDPKAFFYQFTKWTKAQASKFANDIWTDINERNLIENIIPYKQRARLILQKNPDHSVHEIYLRKL